MTRRSLLAVLPCAASAVFGQQPSAVDDVVLKAMRDELDRSRTLTLVNLEAPYYIEYALHEMDSFLVTATLGALVDTRRERARMPRIQVRVGDYQFDNGNYVYSDAGFAARYQLGAFPIDDDYAALRDYFWLGTDFTYKSALEVIARKRAALKNVTVTDQPPDFSKAEAARMVLGVPKLAVGEEIWKARLRDLSGIFASHSRVVSSGVEFQAVAGCFYFVNSEGSRVRTPEVVARLQVRASALAPDGMLLRDSLSYYAREAGKLPPEAELRRGFQGVAENLESLVRAPLEEPYTGPVLFEPRAAAQMLAEVLGGNLSLRRRPVSEPGRPLSFMDSELAGRLGSRILPEFMDVEDDPTQQEFAGRPLFGQYAVDLEGIAPRPLVLVEKGVLRNYLMTRQPMRGVEGTNGRARLRGGFGANAAASGNLFVRTAQPSTLPELRKKLIELCGQRGKPYGLLVRKLDFPSSASPAEYRRLAAKVAQEGGLSHPLSLPTLAYRVYADGREELVRGLRFKGFSTRSLRDIVAAGGEAAVFDYVENGAPFGLMGMGSYVAESSVIAPAVLFEELQLERAEDELPKLPIVAPPALSDAH